MYSPNGMEGNEAFSVCDGILNSTLGVEPVLFPSVSAVKTQDGMEKKRTLECLVT